MNKCATSSVLAFQPCGEVQLDARNQSDFMVGTPAFIALDEPGLSAATYSVLSSFNPHSLESLHNASLMSRVDSKFLLPSTRLDELLEFLLPYYTILEINGMRSFTYQTRYYDTPNHMHYMRHHNGRLNRFKIRKRTYQESQTSYLEVKFKDRNRRTAKTRIQWDMDSPNLCPEAMTFLESCEVPQVELLEAVQSGTYQRIALASEARGERLTIDCNISFQNTASGIRHDIGPWVIAELKQNVIDRHSAIHDWARAHNIRSVPFSKYCMGMYFTGAPELKRNNFHPVARQLRT